MKNTIVVTFNNGVQETYDANAFDANSICVLDTRDFTIVNEVDLSKLKSLGQCGKWFKTKQDAHAYIDMHKKTLSIIDVMNCRRDLINDTGIHKPSEGDFLKALIAFVPEKEYDI